LKGKKEIPPRGAPGPAGKAEGAGDASKEESPKPSEAPALPGVSGPAPAETESESELKRLRAREDELLRALAELQNAQRRRRQEMEQALAYAHEPLVRALLPALDDLERALAATEGREEDPLGVGVRLVLDQLRGTLERDGLEEIRPLDGAFDPELHDAIFQRPAPDRPPHTVLEVVKPGYRYRGRVVRHAQVVVSEDAANAPEEGMS
jgi:molecular chaperone GrpE